MKTEVMTNSMNLSLTSRMVHGLPGRVSESKRTILNLFIIKLNNILDEDKIEDILK